MKKKKIKLLLSINTKQKKTKKKIFRKVTCKIFAEKSSTTYMKKLESLLLFIVFELMWSALALSVCHMADIWILLFLNLSLCKSELIGWQLWVHHVNLCRYSYICSSYVYYLVLSFIHWKINVVWFFFNNNILD